MSFGFGFGFPKNYVAALFSPAQLFTGTTQGVWYDPSDITTLYRDAAGTLPVTAVEQPVGLMLDKRDTAYSVASSNTANSGLGLDAATAINLTGDFTIEAFINLSALPTSNVWQNTPGGYQTIWATGAKTSVDGSAFYIGTTNIFFTVLNDNDIVINTAHGFSINTWYHIAVTRSGNTFRVFIDGVLKQTATSSNAIYQNEKWAIARGEGVTYWDGGWLYGKISNFRAVKGAALYTTNFTKPSAPLTPVAGTVVLTCGNSWSGNPTIYTSGSSTASSGNPFTTGTGNHAFNSSGNSANFPVLSARKNKLLATAALATQNVTVRAVGHVLSFWGTGTITLSGASTAGPLVGTGAGNRVYLEFTPTAGTLTLTVSGSVLKAQLEEINETV